MDSLPVPKLLFAMIPDRLKLPFSFCQTRLMQDLQRCEREEWIDHFVKQNFGEGSQILPLRGPSGAQHPILMAYSDPSCDDFEDTPFLGRCPYFKEVLNSFPFELHAVRLMSLPAGASIKEHQDYDLAYELGAVRLHIPIQTNSMVEFYLNGERAEMNAGECWYLRLSDPHRVFNGGTTNRIHMVIDAPVCQSMREPFGLVV